MTPDLDLQLKVVIKALRDTVMPALDPKQAAAAEQLGLSIATLAMVRERLPYLAARTWIDLADAVALGQRIIALSTDALPDSDLAEAAALLRDPCPPVDALDLARRRVLAGISTAIETACDETVEALMRIVTEEAGRTTDMARAWSKIAGFEPDPAQIPELATLISEPRRMPVDE